MKTTNIRMGIIITEVRGQVIRISVSGTETEGKDLGLIKKIEN